MKTVGVPTGLAEGQDIEVVIGRPVLSPEEVGMRPDCPRFTNRFMPQILKDLGVVKSVSQVKRDRPDLFCDVSEGQAFFSICIGKPTKHHSSIWVTFLVGEV